MVESSLYKKGLQKTQFIYNPSVQLRPLASMHLSKHPQAKCIYGSGLFVCQLVRDPYKFNIFRNGNSCKEILD